MKKRKYTAIAVIFLLGATLACTIPVNFVAEPEIVEKIVYVEITSTPEDVAELDEVEEQEPAEAETESVPVNMDGAWTIWQGSSEQKLSIDFLQKNADLIGNAATNDGHSLMFDGVISADGTTVSGTWESTDGTSGNFQIELNDALNSFSGNLGGGVPFCGTRMGSSKPYPCLN